MSNSQEYRICNLFFFTLKIPFYKDDAKVVNKMLKIMQHCNINDNRTLYHLLFMLDGSWMWEKVHSSWIIVHSKRLCVLFDITLLLLSMNHQL
ncbi:intein/homing endonuclease [Mucilaginibacter sp. SG564]|nr:intein/homing endonuclease [Mucilaginibacter sp. SG564]